MTNNKKTVIAVSPYKYEKGINFKHYPYDAWCKLGGEYAKAHYPCKALHGLFYRYSFPAFSHNHSEARLRFVQPVSLLFDTFPDYMCYEIIPFFWDCWPRYFDNVCKWLIKYRTKSAIFTSSQVATKIKNLFPQMNVMSLTEGIIVDDYPAGKDLSKRENQLYEIGTGRRCYLKSKYPEEYQKFSKLPINGLIRKREDYIKTLCDTKITITFPRCDLMPEETGDIETLTQRYWETMLTRSVILGRAPKELTKLIGYNPVIDIDKSNPIGQIEDILSHIDDYQPLVDKNRQTAFEKGSWDIRMKEVASWLKLCGYICSIDE